MNKDLLLALLREEIRNEKMIEQELLSSDMSATQIQRILVRFDATMKRRIETED